MKITVFNSSPRKERSNTHFMVKEFLAGAKEAGAEVENIFLANMKISPCLACFECWKKLSNKCIIKDDMEELIKKFINSDIAVFATPLYIDNVSGIMKNFMDRLLPIIDPHFEKDENNESRHLKRYKQYPKLVVISNSGFPEQSHFQVLKLLFRRIARNIHTQIIGEIYRSAGEILQINNPLFKPLLWKYQKTLRKAGKEIVNNLSLSKETILELETPIISDELYIKKANKYWDRILEHNNIK